MKRQFLHIDMMFCYTSSKNPICNIEFVVLFIDQKDFTAPPTVTLRALSDKIPSSLQFVSEHPTGSGCITVDHHSITGDILLGCTDGMEIYSRDSGEVRHGTDHVRARVVEYKGDIIMSHHRNKTLIKVIKYDTVKRTSEFLFPFPSTLASFSLFSVSDHFIVTIGNNNQTIKLYDRQTGHRAGSNTLTTQTLPEYKVIKNLKLLTDDTLLVTGWDTADTYKLNKYRINRDKLHLIWSCKEVPNLAVGIAVDDRGRIYVSGACTKTIYVLSDEGEIALILISNHSWRGHVF